MATVKLKILLFDGNYKQFVYYYLYLI